MEQDGEKAEVLTISSVDIILKLEISILDIKNEFSFIYRIDIRRREYE